METITVPLSLGNVGIIETDGGSFPRVPSFLKRPREQGFGRIPRLGRKNEEAGGEWKDLRGNFRRSCGHIRPSDN